MEHGHGASLGSLGAGRREDYVEDPRSVRIVQRTTIRCRSRSEAFARYCSNICTDNSARRVSFSVPHACGDYLKEASTSRVASSFG